MSNNYFTLITGASEGFGKTLAIECAKRKMNLILVALPGSELPSLANFIRHSFGVTVYSIEKDLSEESECYDLLAKILDLQLPVNVLINNVGNGSTMLFEDASPELLGHQVKLNVLSTTLITRLFLEELKKNKPSFLLNVSSLSSFFYLPRKAVYGSTKAYIYYFSKALRKELKPMGIHVSVVCPGGMNTNAFITLMNRFSNWITKASAMDPEQVAPIAIDGLLKGKEVIIPGKMNRIFKWIDHFIPARINNFLTAYEMSHLHLPTVLMNKKVKDKSIKTEATFH